MEKSICIFLFVLLSFIDLNAQTSFTCSHRENCKWNVTTEEFDDCDRYEDPSMFVLNADETMFTHTTESIKSTYYVNERNYDSEAELWLYSVTSDVGNKYIYAFDPKNKEIRALYTRDGVSMLIRFYVKAVF